ncbi:MAG: hypothetical protein JO357_03705 [Hyphomicrobiales bacterium]|nr:hypothetical protein [Hyphomicrobiales bacterium]MBV9754893.1 hypothetical protein [Hyphomicrobiales bacterium]
MPERTLDAPACLPKTFNFRLRQTGNRDPKFRQDDSVGLYVCTNPAISCNCKLSPNYAS